MPKYYHDVSINNLARAILVHLDLWLNGYFVEFVKKYFLLTSLYRSIGIIAILVDFHPNRLYTWLLGRTFPRTFQGSGPLGYRLGKP